MDKQDKVFTRDDGTQVLTYGVAYANTKAEAEVEAIQIAKLIEVSDNLPGLAHEFSRKINGCHPVSRLCKNGRWACYLNRNLGKPAEAEANHPKLADKPAKSRKNSAKAKVA